MSTDAPTTPRFTAYEMLQEAFARAKSDGNAGLMLSAGTAMLEHERPPRYPSDFTGSAGNSA